MLGEGPVAVMVMYVFSVVVTVTSVVQEELDVRSTGATATLDGAPLLYEETVAGPTGDGPTAE